MLLNKKINAANTVLYYDLLDELHTYEARRPLLFVRQEHTFQGLIRLHLEQTQFCARADSYADSYAEDMSHFFFSFLSSDLSPLCLSSSSVQILAHRLLQTPAA